MWKVWGMNERVQLPSDGTRFVTVTDVDALRADESEEMEPEPPRIRIVQNWAEEFRDREQ